MLKFKKIYPSLVALSLLMSSVDADARLVFAEQGKPITADIKAKFAELEALTKSDDKFVAAKANVELGELLIAGYYEKPDDAALQAFSYFEKGFKALKTLPKHHEHPLAEALPGLKMRAITRLNQYYNREDDVPTNLHIPKEARPFFGQVTHMFGAVQSGHIKEMYDQVIGEQRDWFSSEAQAEAYYQLGMIETEGSEIFIEYLERAVARLHVGAISALAKYEDRKVEELEKAIKRNIVSGAIDGKEAFKSFAQQMPGIALHHFLLRMENGEEQFMTHAVSDILIKESKRQAVKMDAFVSTSRGDVQGCNVVNTKLFSAICQRTMDISRAIQTYDVWSLMDIYGREAFRLYKLAACGGDVDVCEAQGVEYLLKAKSAGGNEDLYKAAAFFFYHGCLSNDAACLYYLGDSFKNGQGVSQSDELATECWYWACLGNNGAAKMAFERQGLDWVAYKPKGRRFFVEQTNDQIQEPDYIPVKRPVKLREDGDLDL